MSAMNQSKIAKNAKRTKTYQNMSGETQINNAKARLLNISKSSNSSRRHETTTSYHGPRRQPSPQQRNTAIDSATPVFIVICINFC